MSRKVIFLLDMDQFYAAVEIRHQPWLRGKPVIVGGSPTGRGIVTTASYEARRYGIKSGMSALDAVRLCPHATFVRPDFNKYLAASRHIIGILCSYTDRVEPVSVDEAYMDVSDVVWRYGGVEPLAMEIKRRVRDEEGLSCTIGAGPNRLVAKVSSGFNKPDGYTYLPAEIVPQVFRDLPVGELYGIGKATERVLHGFGILTAGQLGAFPVDILRRRFGVLGEELSRIGRGDGNDVVLVPHERPQEKSMGHDHTFSRDICTDTELLGRLHLLCEKVARRLRTASLAGRVVSVKIRYHGFETVLHGHKVRQYVQHELDIFPIAERLFRESWRVGEPVRLVGIHMADLIDASEIRQQELFVAPPETSNLSAACDAVKQRYGDEAIGFASGVFHSGEQRQPGRRRAPFFNPFGPKNLVGQ